MRSVAHIAPPPSEIRVQRFDLRHSHLRPGLGETLRLGPPIRQDRLLRNPMTSIVRCCARAASGHVAAPPSSVMKWRRLVSSMGSSPEPAVPAYRRLRMLRKRPQVLGLALNRSDTGRAPSML